MPDILGPNSRFKYQTLGASGCSLRLEEVHYSSRQVQDAASSLACCNLENTNLLLESKRCCLKTLHSEQKAWKTTWGARNVHKYVHDIVPYGPGHSLPLEQNYNCKTTSALES